MKSEGYNWTYPITPYIHMMVYHVPQMLERFQNLKQFTGQGKMNRCKILILVSVKNENFSYTLLYFLGVEKKHDDMRNAFHR